MPRRDPGPREPQRPAGSPSACPGRGPRRAPGESQERPRQLAGNAWLVVNAGAGPEAGEVRGLGGVASASAFCEVRGGQKTKLTQNGGPPSS